MDWSSFTGAGVRIAVIDSGIDSGFAPLESQIIGGVHIARGPRQTIDRLPRSPDEIGHGTACAAIIHGLAPNALLHDVKVIDAEDSVAPPELLAAAIDWSVDNGAQILSISAGARSAEAFAAIDTALQRAHASGAIVVAATPGLGIETYPANCDGVISVVSSEQRGRFAYACLDERKLIFSARGDLQALVGLGGTRWLSEGSSFAAPRLAALVALLKEAHPSDSRSEILAKLIGASGDQARSLGEGIETRASTTETQLDWIKSSILYPLNKEVHSLVRFRHRLPGRVQGVVGLRGTGQAGQDAAEIIGLPSANLPVQSSIRSALRDADTLILGDLREAERLLKRPLQREAILTAIQMGRNVYSILPFDTELRELADKANVRLHHPPSNVEDFLSSLSRDFSDTTEKSVTPVLGVFGTSKRQGKFTLQLTLADALKRRGYSVGHISTESQGYLLGADAVVPISRSIHAEQIASLARAAVLDTQNCKEPDMIIIGGQSGLLPVDVSAPATFASLSQFGLIWGSSVDFVILVVNSLDSNQRIAGSIAALESACQCRVVALAFSRLAFRLERHSGHLVTVDELWDDTQVSTMRERLERDFHLPAIEALTSDGPDQLVKVVIDAFSGDESRRA